MKKSLADKRIDEVLARPVPENQKEIWDQYQIGGLKVPADVEDTVLREAIAGENKPSQIFVVGAAAKRIVTGFEIGNRGYSFVSGPSIAAARRPNPIRDAGESDFNPEVLRNGPGALNLSTINDLITAGANPELAEKMRAAIGRAGSIRNIGEIDPLHPSCIPDYPSSAERMNLMNALLSTSGLVFAIDNRITMSPRILDGLQHAMQWGPLEEYVRTTAKAYRREAKSLAKAMRKASKRAIKKVTKHK